MKKILLVAFIIPAISKAQVQLVQKDSLIKTSSYVIGVKPDTKVENINQKEWGKLGLDSFNFCKLYGSEFEYNYQAQIQWQSKHKHLALFIGAKYFYLNELSFFMQETKNYNSLDNGTTDFVLENKLYIEKEPNIVIHPQLDKNGRIKRVTITGPADDLIFLFIYYWNESSVSLNQLKSRQTVVEDFASDRISFTWSGVNPVITITQTTNLSYVPLSVKINP